MTNLYCRLCGNVSNCLFVFPYIKLFCRTWSLYSNLWRTSTTIHTEIQKDRAIFVLHMKRILLRDIMNITFFRYRSHIDLDIEQYRVTGIFVPALSAYWLRYKGMHRLLFIYLFMQVKIHRGEYYRVVTWQPPASMSMVMNWVYELITSRGSSWLSFGNSSDARIILRSVVTHSSLPAYLRAEEWLSMFKSTRRPKEWER